MFKGVYDERIILGVPVLVFVALVILVLTTGPILIRRAYQKKRQEVPSLSSRVWPCFWAVILVAYAIVAVSLAAWRFRRKLV